MHVYIKHINYTDTKTKSNVPVAKTDHCNTHNL